MTAQASASASKSLAVTRAAVARNTAQFRRGMGYSQEVLAREASLPRKTVYNTETHGTAGMRTLEKLARVFGVSVATMLEADQGTAQAVFLAGQVARLGDEARTVFFRALGKSSAGGHVPRLVPEPRKDSPSPSAQPLEPDFRPTSFSLPADLDEGERKFAAVEVPALFRRPKSEWRKRLAEEPRFFSIAAGWEMLAQGERTVYAHPRKAVDCFQLAVFAAEELAKRLPAPPHELRAMAWKDLGIALSEGADYPGAEAALDTARDAAAFCTNREQILARISLARALMLMRSERWDEALLLVRESRMAFDALKDSAGYTMSLDSEAGIHILRGDLPAGISILTGLVDSATDDRMRARYFFNLAIAYRRSGDLTSARSYLAKASALHVAFGWTHALHKGEWTLGKILAMEGDIDAALKTLERASAGFQSLDDAENVIRVDLDRCEIEIDNNRQRAETFDRLRAAAAYAKRKNLPKSACRALMFLERLGEAAKVTDIRYVIEFMQALEIHRHRKFVPPKIAA